MTEPRGRLDANEEAELDATPPLRTWTIEDQIRTLEGSINDIRPLDEHELNGSYVVYALEDMLELIQMLRKERDA